MVVNTICSNLDIDLNRRHSVVSNVYKHVRISMYRLTDTDVLVDIMNHSGITNTAYLYIVMAVSTEAAPEKWMRQSCERILLHRPPPHFLLQK